MQTGYIHLKELDSLNNYKNDELPSPEINEFLELGKYLLSNADMLKCTFETDPMYGLNSVNLDFYNFLHYRFSNRP